MKKALSLLALLFMTAMLPAEAPELRAVMPNSWRKITRLPPTEEAAFLRDNGGLITATERELPKFIEYPFYDSSFRGMEGGETRVYREQAGEDVFYRLITANSDSPDFSDQRGILFVQTLVYEHRGRMVILGVAPYNSYAPTYDGNGILVRCRSLDIIRAGGRARGILGTVMSYNGLESPRMEKGQIQGENWAAYILLGDTLRVLDGSPAAPGTLNFTGYITGLYRYEGAPYVWIEGSMCLVDPAVPLRYSLQNAFDGDPATSFVENTGDDLMSISISGKGLIPGQGRRGAIINGYAQSMALYRSNNRVRTVEYLVDITVSSETELLDDTLSWQFLEGSGTIGVRSIYPGERYNDTCIAEYNVYTTENGWLFGDIDE